MGRCPRRLPDAISVSSPVVVVRTFPSSSRAPQSRPGRDFLFLRHNGNAPLLRARRPFARSKFLQRSIPGSPRHAVKRVHLGLWNASHTVATSSSVRAVNNGLRPDRCVMQSVEKAVAEPEETSPWDAFSLAFTKFA